MKVKALYDFVARTENEISFKKGDIVKVLDQDEGWWLGELDGKEGLFPANYVEAVQEQPRSRSSSFSIFSSHVLLIIE